MPGEHTLRILLIAPIGAKLNGIGTFLQANGFPGEDVALWPRLSVTGNAPATHAWSNRACTDLQARTILFRCVDLVNAQQAGAITKPSVVTWDGWTKAEKRAWILSVRNAMRTVYGIGVVLIIQDGEWDDPDGIAGLVGLLRIDPAPH